MSSVRSPHTLRAFIAGAALVVAALVTRSQSAGAVSAPTGRQSFGALAPAFVSNAGEVDRTARFLSVGGGRPVFFTRDGVRIVGAALGERAGVVGAGLAAWEVVGDGTG